jgi:excisionase family DNA binding protein
MQPAEKRYHTINDICQLQNISNTTLWRLRKKGEIPFMKAGNTVLFDLDKVIASLEANSKIGGQNGKA